MYTNNNSNYYNYNTHKIYRIGNKQCKICGSSGWCGVIPSANKILCMRQSAGSIGVAANGAYIHSGTYDPFAFGYDDKPDELIPMASLDRRNIIYNHMLSVLPLLNDDLDRLMNIRKLDIAAINTLRYKSVADIAEQLHTTGYILEFVPGFYHDNSKWCMNSYNGMFIPILDITGRIQALQIRTTNDTQKYIWFSSRDKPYGAPSGCPIHFRMQRDFNYNEEQIIKELWITESAIKADIFWCKTNSQETTIIASAGCNTNVTGLIEATTTINPSVAIIAFDGDWKTNKHVNGAITKLGHALINKASTIPKVAIWRSTEGIDDVIIEGRTITVIDFNEWLDKYATKNT